MRLLARFLVIAAAVWIVAAVVPGVTVREGVSSYLVIALVFAVVNVLVKPVLKLLSFPLLLLTLGLFLIAINAAMFGLTALLTDRLEVDGFGPAVIASLVISAVTWTGDNVLGLKKKKD
jgi:putative membrane protein